jgi:hypothetical protein
VTGIAPLPARRPELYTLKGERPASGPLIEAVVIGRTATNATLLRLAHGTLTLPNLPPPAMGSIVVLRIEGAQHHVVAIRPPPTTGMQTKADAPDLQHRWLALESAVAASNRHGLPAPRVPQPGPRLLAEIGKLLGELDGGETPTALAALATGARRAGLSALGPQLEEEAKLLVRLDEHGDWRLTLIPFGIPPQQLRIYRRARTAHASDDGAQRLVVELDTSPYGRLQLDGLAKRRSFDVILRTEHAIPAEERAALEDRFVACLTPFRCTGVMTFQSTGSFPAIGFGAARTVLA